MENTVPFNEYMRHMNLRTWILTHLQNKTIHGLHYEHSEGTDICFVFPWKRLGDQNWKQDWDILFKYAEHRNFEIPTNFDDSEGKEKLTEIKNKFRNAIDKSQEFEKLQGGPAGYRMYRLKSNCQPPPKRKRKFEDMNSAFSPPSSTCSYMPTPSPGMYQQQDYAAGDISTSIAPIQQQSGADQGYRDFLDFAGDAELSQILDGIIDGETRLGDMDPTAQTGWQQNQPPYCAGTSTSTSNYFGAQPVAAMLPENYTVQPISLKKIEEVMRIGNISDAELARFSISVSLGNERTTDLLSLRDGLQIIFTKDVNNIIREHDSVVGGLLDDIVGDNIKKYSYGGSDEHVKTILKRTYGGIILKYERKALHIYRLCQARVFVESQFHQPKRKVERCCRDAGTPVLNTFSYQKFVTDVQKNPTIDVKDTTRITIGAPSVYLDVYPECTRRLKAALKPCASIGENLSINSVDQSLDHLTSKFGSTSL